MIVCVGVATRDTIYRVPRHPAADHPAFPVDPVSTLGAGDVFHGALLACLARGLSLRDSLVRANACAALSCRALDGRSAIPSWDELEASVA